MSSVAAIPLPQWLLPLEWLLCMANCFTDLIRFAPTAMPTAIAQPYWRFCAVNTVATKHDSLNDSCLGSSGCAKKPIHGNTHGARRHTGQCVFVVEGGFQTPDTPPFSPPALPNVQAGQYPSCARRQVRRLEGGWPVWVTLPAALFNTTPGRKHSRPVGIVVGTTASRAARDVIGALCV
jgi:hypothetical protein